MAAYSGQYAHTPLSPLRLLLRTVRCLAEQERLVGVLVGQEGVDTRKWPSIPRKMERLARHTVQRQDATEQLAHRLDHWDLKRMLESTESSIRVQMRAQLKSRLEASGVADLAGTLLTPRSAMKKYGLSITPGSAGGSAAKQVQTLLAGLQQRRLASASAGHANRSNAHGLSSLTTAASATPGSVSPPKKRDAKVGAPRRTMLEGGQYGVPLQIILCGCPGHLMNAETNVRAGPARAPVLPADLTFVLGRFA